MFFQMATRIPFMAETMRSSPPVQFNTFEKVNVGGKTVLHNTVASLFGSAWEGRGLSLPESTKATAGVHSNISYFCLRWIV